MLTAYTSDRIKNRIYKIGESVGRVQFWSVAAAKFIDSVPNSEDVVYLCSAEGDDTVSYLVETLKFYGYPLGELADCGKSDEELLAEVKAEKLSEFDAAMAGVDQALVRPLSDLIGAVVAPALMSAAERDEAGDGDLTAAELEISRQKFAALRALQIENRALRAEMLEAASLDAVQAFTPVTAAALAPDSGGAGGAAPGTELAAGAGVPA